MKRVSELFAELQQHIVGCLISVLFECCNVGVGVDSYWLRASPVEEMPSAAVDLKTVIVEDVRGFFSTSVLLHKKHLKE